MNELTVGISAVFILIAMIGLGFPIAGIFLILGLGGSALLTGPDMAVGSLGPALYFNVASPNWAALPLFVLLGCFAAHGGLAKDVFFALNRLTRRIRGALGVATCFSCALFGTLCGSPAASAAIFAKLAMPEMARAGYDKSFSVGIIASAGTFAAIIPPSGLMIVYCLFTQQSIGALFAAGFLPGILTATVSALFIMYRVSKNPNLIRERPQAEETPSTPWQTLKKMFPATLIAGSVLGTTYTGFCTPTEAAALGCIITLAVGICSKDLRDLKTVRMALRDAAGIMSLILFIIISALYFSRFIAITGLPTELATWVTSLELPRSIILLGIIAIWFLLGMVLVPDGIYALCLPIFFPLIVQLGYDPIWFGIITIKLSCLANLTPPVGMNIFTVHSVVKDQVTISEIYNGTLPFVFCDVAVLFMLILFPEITLYLPRLLFRS